MGQMCDQYGYNTKLPCYNVYKRTVDLPGSTSHIILIDTKTHIIKLYAVLLSRTQKDQMYNFFSMKSKIEAIYLTRH